MASKQKGYQFADTATEDHQMKIYCVTFNHVSRAHEDIFASVGGNRATVYQMQEDGSFETLQVYVDDQKTEEFYVCDWSVDEVTGDPLLLLAGLNGVLRVINLETQTLAWSAVGHGGPINDTSAHPIRPSLVLTASKDESLRLWNLQTQCCVLVMVGEGRHLNEVLTIDWHPYDGHRFVSAGMDNMVKIWSVQEQQSLVDRSFEYNAKAGMVFETKELPSPIFTTVHGHYVDCVRWLGDYILSKSVNEKIMLWAPDFDSPQAPKAGRFSLINELLLPDSESVWFMRFGLDYRATTLACGNKKGQVFLWNPHVMERRHRVRLSRQGLEISKAKKVDESLFTVRQVSLSADGSKVVFCCDDATVWGFHRQPSDDSNGDDDLLRQDAPLTSGGGPTEDDSDSDAAADMVTD